MKEAVIQEHEVNHAQGKVMNMPIQVWDTNGNQRRMRSIYADDGVLVIDIDPTEIIAAP
jgi:hypothetical protein